MSDHGSSATRYLMVTPQGRRHWLTERECAEALNGPWIDGEMALDLDSFTERPLTESEKQRISYLADAIWETK